MRYVTIDNLSQMIRSNLWKIPHDIDLVVGIPRSGMVPASIIALLLNTRLTDIDSFTENHRIYSNGLSRGEYVRKHDIGKILVVDDSINRGQSLLNAKQKLQAISDKGYDFLFCAPIATSQGASMVDIFFTIIDDTRVFEWNILHHSILGNACVDIDGVLCLDPEEDDDGEKYRTFLQTATPLFLPTCKVDTLISCRLEKYRTLTENWLMQNDVKYNQLIMLDLPDKASRLAWNKHGAYKGEYYKQRTDCVLFIESSMQQAKIIAEISNKAVFCIETNTLTQVTPSISTKKRVLHAIRNKFPREYYWLQDKYCKL